MKIKMIYNLNSKNFYEVFKGNFEDLIVEIKLYNELGINPQLIVYPDDHKSHLDIINLINLSEKLRFNLSYYDNNKNFYYHLITRW